MSHFQALLDHHPVVIGLQRKSFPVEHCSAPRQDSSPSPKDSRANTPDVGVNDLELCGLSKNPNLKLGYIIGRSNKLRCDYNIRASGVSGRHLRIYVNGFRSWMAMDLSVNGTIVNGHSLISSRRSTHSKNTFSERLAEIALRPDHANQIHILASVFYVWV